MSDQVIIPLCLVFALILIGVMCFGFEYLQNERAKANKLEWQRSMLQADLDKQKQDLAKAQEELQREKVKPHYENAEHRDREAARRFLKLEKLVVVDVDIATRQLCGVLEVRPSMADCNKYQFAHGDRRLGISGLLAKQILGEGEYSDCSPLCLNGDTPECVYMVIRRGQFGALEMPRQNEIMGDVMFKMRGADGVRDALKKWGVVLPPVQ